MRKELELKLLLLDGCQRTLWTYLPTTEMSTRKPSRSSSSSLLEPTQNRLKFQWQLPSRSGENQFDKKADLPPSCHPAICVIIKISPRIIPGEGPNCSSSVTMSFLVPGYLQVHNCFSLVGRITWDCYISYKTNKQLLCWLLFTKHSAIEISILQNTNALQKTVISNRINQIVIKQETTPEPTDASVYLEDRPAMRFKL